MTPVIAARQLAKWYGNVLGLSDVTLEIEPGVTGLLGPNGAGKSTFLKLLTGQLKPSLGEVRILGRRVRNDASLFSRIGYCPEQDAFYEEMTGREFVGSLLILQGFSPAEARSRAERALATVDLLDDADRLIRAYSRGMRQRLKFAQAIAHDPEIIILDEPLNGLDPLGKRKLLKLVREFRGEGRTILISSHVLPEIEALTRTIILIHQGKIFAKGDIHEIRDLIDTHPHLVAIRCPEPRALAARFLADDHVLKVDFPPDGKSVLVETNDRDRFFSRLGRLIAGEALEVEEITSPDDNLQAVFDYLVGK